MLSISRKTFRFLVLIGWPLSVAYVAAVFAEQRYFPPELKSYWDRKVAEPLTAVDFALLLLLLVAIPLSVVTTVGLYRFKSWARTLYLVCVVASFLPLPPYEPLISMPFSSRLGTACTMLSGFVLALLYFSPLSRYFEPRGGDQQTSTGSDTSWQT